MKELKSRASWFYHTFFILFPLTISLDFGEELKDAGCKEEELATFKASLNWCQCCLYRTYKSVTETLFFSIKDGLS
jgi:hypothetical protein